jgi:hypothetical protein
MIYVLKNSFITLCEAGFAICNFGKKKKNGQPTICKALSYHIQPKFD